MIRSIRIETTSLALLVAGLVASATPASCDAAGYYNMPSTFRQCVGCGFGAGYHSRFMLEPSYKDSVASPGVRRARPALSMATAMARPVPAAASHYHQPQYLWCPTSASNNACEAPALPASHVQHQPAYAPAPIVAPGPTLFAAPPIILPEPIDEGPDSPSDITPEQSLPEPAPLD